MGGVGLPLLLGAGVGAGVLLIVVGVVGVRVDPSGPASPRWSRWWVAARSPGVTVRIVAAAAAGFGVWAVTGWPVAAVGSAGLLVAWPRLFGGAQAEQRQIDRLEALVGWTESLRDTIAAHASLEQAIPVSAVHASPLIRPALVRLVGQIRARVPMDRALRRLAAELDDPSADLVIAALMLSSRRRGDRLGQVLSGLAGTAREELEMRRRIYADRAQIRRGMQIIVVVTAAFAVFLVVFGGDYVAPYGTPAGQVVLAVVVAVFAAAFGWMRRLSEQRPVAAFLDHSDTADPAPARPSTAAIGGGDPAGRPGMGMVSR
jgi:Flp pilus assembly protein TadB